MSYKRGDIHWIDFPKRDPRGSEIEKTRPCVVLSLTKTNEIRRTVVVVPLTSSPEPVPPIAIAVPSAGPDSVAVCDQVTTVDKKRVKGRFGVLSGEDMRALEDSVRAVLGL
jgi:mRNA interferase MazF